MTRRPYWTINHCNDHIHIMCHVPLLDGGAALFASPGLPRNYELVNTYLEFISAWTEVQMTREHYVKREDFPRALQPLEEPLEFVEDNEE